MIETIIGGVLNVANTVVGGISQRATMREARKGIRINFFQDNTARYMPYIIMLFALALLTINRK